MSLNLTSISKATDGFLQYSLLAVVLILLVSSPFGRISNTPNPTLYGQYILVLYLAVVICVPVIILFTLKRTPLRITLTDLLLLGFVSLMLLRYAVIQPANLLAITYLVGILAIYIAFRQLSYNNLIFSLIAIAFSAIIESIYGNLQLHGFSKSNNLFFEITGTFFNPAPFAGFLVLAVPAALGLYSIQLESSAVSSNLRRSIASAAVFFVIIIVPSADSRAAWLAIVVGAGYFLLNIRPWTANPFLNKLRANKAAFTVGLVAVCFVIVTCLYFYRQNSASGRVFIWQVSSKMLAKNPIVGQGPGKFKANYMEYQALYFEKNTAAAQGLNSDNVQYPYSEFLHIFIELGVVGLLIAALLVWSVLKKNVENKNNVWRVTGQAGVISLVVFSLFSYPAEIPPILVLGLFYLALVSRNSQSIFTIGNTGPQVILRWVPVLGMILIPFAFSKVSRYHNALTLWNNANILYNIGQYDDAIDSYILAYPDLVTDGLFLSNYGKALQKAGQHQKSIEIVNQSKSYLTDSYTYLTLASDYTFLKDYQKAENCYLKAMKMVPAQLYPQYGLIKLYHISGQVIKMRSEGEKFMSRNAKVSSDAVNQMKKEIMVLLGNSANNAQ